jgi:hypothetical protein
MAIIKGFEYDLFVSYAHSDNFGEDERGWVTQFVNRLRAALIQKLGIPGEVMIFRDSGEVRANSRLPDLLAAARQSAIFVAIGSPSYVEHEWTLRELEAFADKLDDLSRVFLVECLPLNSHQHYPPPLNDHIRTQFWKPSGSRNIPKPLSPQGDADDFDTMMRTLATDIGEKLLALRLLPQAAKARLQSDSFSRTAAPGNRGAAAQTSAPKKTILLAQTTEEVEDESDQLRNFLQQYDAEIAVLPASGYPQGGEAFKSAFQLDIARTDLFIQLLGKRIGRMPPDLPEGYTRFQAQAAKSSHVPLLQWRRPDLDLGAVSDPAYRTMLESETVIASGLEAFKLQVLKEVRKGKEKARPSKSGTVFINADSKDREVAKEVKKECLQNALTAILPWAGPQTEATRRDLEENLIDSDVLVFIYGDTTYEWIRGQLRLFNKIRPRREAPPKLLAICTGPPPKPDIDVSFPDAQLIECPSGWNLEAIRKLLAEFGE